MTLTFSRCCRPEAADRCGHHVTSNVSQVPPKCLPMSISTTHHLLSLRPACKSSCSNLWPCFSPSPKCIQDVKFPSERHKIQTIQPWSVNRKAISSTRPTSGYYSSVSTSFSRNSLLPFNKSWKCFGRSAWTRLLHPQEFVLCLVNRIVVLMLIVHKAGLDMLLPDGWKNRLSHPQLLFHFSW